MKKVSIAILAAFILLFMNSLAQAQDSKCIIYDNDSDSVRSFIKVKGDPTDTSDGIYSIEKFETGAFKFLLKKGHATIFLTAYKNNRFHASTLISTGSATSDTYLNLQVVDDLEKDLQPRCDNLVEK